MHARQYMDGYTEYQSLMDSSDQFVEAFPHSARGCQLIAYLHARRAMALSSHGNNMGEVQDALLFILCFGFSNLLHLDLDTFTMQESGRKWHAQALEAARKSRNLFPDFSDAILFEGIALVGMTKRADACDALEKVATLLNRMLEQLSDKSRQCFCSVYALYTNMPACCSRVT